MRYSLQYTHIAAIAARAPTVIYVPTGLWFDATKLVVNVSSTPFGAVQWSLTNTDGAVALPASGILRIRVDAPLAFAVVEITSAQGASTDARIDVEISLAASS